MLARPAIIKRRLLAPCPGNKPAEQARLAEYPTETTSRESFRETYYCNGGCHRSKTFTKRPRLPKLWSPQCRSPSIK